MDFCRKLLAAIMNKPQCLEVVEVSQLLLLDLEGKNANLRAHTHTHTCTHTHAHAHAHAHTHAQETPVPGSILNPPFVNPLDDMSPFFQKQSVKGHANDVFAAYGRLLADICLVLPYQV